MQFHLPPRLAPELASLFFSSFSAFTRFYREMPLWDTSIVGCGRCPCRRQLCNFAQNVSRKELGRVPVLVLFTCKPAVAPRPRSTYLYDHPIPAGGVPLKVPELPLGHGSSWNQSERGRNEFVTFGRRDSRP